MFGYEYTKIQAQEEKIVLSPVNGALLSMMAFYKAQLVFEGGMATLVNVISDDQKIIDAAGKWLAALLV